MINKINLLKSVGPFDNVSPHPNTTFKKLTLIYGENGKGKTTLANIFRSLASGDHLLIEERRRLGAVEPPHIIIEEENGTLIYQDGQWQPHLLNIAVFDDNFVVQNICSGMEVSSDHRKNLHGLIIGEEGIGLNSAHQTALAKINKHNIAIREKKAGVQSLINGNLDVDDFCKLPVHPDIENAISEAEKNINTAQSSGAIKGKNEFQTIKLPALDIVAITAVLQKDLPALGTDATNMVKNHLAKLGEDAQDWVSRGVKKIILQEDEEICPFCDQGLTDVSLIDHYKDYFGSEYNNLKTEIKTLDIKTKKEHDNTIRVEFRHAVSAIKEATVFWKEHINISDVDVATIDGINADEIVSVWKTAIESILDILRKKVSAPLEKITLPEEVMMAVTVYENHKQKISGFSELLQSYNAQIITLKEKMNEVDLERLENICGKLKYTRDRYTEPTKTKCQEYLNEQEAKKLAEREKDTAKAALDAYSETIFKKYQDAINTYLGKFLTDFRLVGMEDENYGGKKFCTYKININNTDVNVTAKDGKPSFKNTLSAGDRNALALAFFFVSLDKDVTLAEKIVVIDDPMTSLDRHRRSYTIKHIVALEDRVKQVILLSHSGYFLYKIWKEAVQKIKNTPITSLQINHSGTSSNLTTLDICNKFVEKHMQRRKMISEYINSPNPDKKSEVTSALRLMLDDFLNIAYPESFSGKATLGAFIEKCRRAIPNNIILNKSDIDELTDLNDFAKKFHHTSDPMDEDSDIELINYCKRFLSFTRRPT